MSFQPPESFNIADYFLDDRVKEGRGDREAIALCDKTLTYADVQSLANRYGNVLRSLGVQQEDRVMIALPDGPWFPGSFFGTLKIGAVVVMVNPYLKPDEIDYFFEYTRARVAVIHRDQLEKFDVAAKKARHLKRLLVVGEADHDHPARADPGLRQQQCCRELSRHHAASHGDHGEAGLQGQLHEHGGPHGHRP